jgi:hypothetical protein
MSSIIKVDTIQTAAGGTPTAADLGLNTSGNIINVTAGTAGGNFTSSSTFSITATSLTDTGISWTVNKTQSSSKIILALVIHFNTDFSNQNYMGNRHQFYESGDLNSSLFLNTPSDSLYFFKNLGSSFRWDFYNHLPILLEDNTSATGTRTYKWYSQTVTHGNVRGGRVEFTAYEIAS